MIVAPLSDYRRSIPGPQGLVIGYATPTDADFHQALDTLCEVLSRR